MEPLTTTTGAAGPEPQPDRPRRGRLALIAGTAAVAAVVGGVVGCTGVFDAPAPQDPYEAAAERAGAEMLAMPEFEERFGDLDEDAAFRAGMELGIAAIPHLPDAELDAWLSITIELLDGLDTEQCALVARADPETGADAMLDVMRTLELESFERYLGIVSTGVGIHLRGAPDPVPPSAAELEAAFAALLADVGHDRMLEVDRLLADPQAAPDDELCAAMRELYAAIADLEPAARRMLLRFVTDPGAAT